jgi:hypothetical protein
MMMMSFICSFRNKNQPNGHIPILWVHVHDNWDRIIGTETTVKSVITFFYILFFFQPR